MPGLVRRLSPRKANWRLLEEAHVAVTPGKDFGLNQPRRYLRFAYTASGGIWPKGWNAFARS